MSGIYRGPNGSATADALNIDGDKGDVTVSNSGVEWTINSGVVDTTKLGGDITTAGKALLDDADASAQRATLGLGNSATATIGTDVLAFDSNLQDFVDTFTLPTSDTTSGFVLTTNGTGTLQLTAPGGISDADYGDISVSTGGTVWTIDNDVVTYAKIQNVSATDKILGRSTAGAGDIEEIACTLAGRALLDDVDASAQRTTLGLGSLATLNTITNTELDTQYIDDLTAVTAVSGDYVAIADTSDSGNKKKTLVSDIVALATTSFASEAEYQTGTDTSKALNSAVARAKNVVLATPIVTTSGTNIDFTSIPSWAKEIEININGTSTNSTSPLILQLGDSGGIETTSYLGEAVEVVGAVVFSFSTSFQLMASWAAVSTLYGSIKLSLINTSTNSWSMFFVLGNPAGQVYMGGGTKTLSGVLDRIRVTTASGTGVFDAGEININYK